jgi:hypothetical protein
MSELTITRGALKKIAREAMRNSGITKDQRTKLTEVAETTEAVVINWWRIGDCGCLVGTAYPEYFRKKDGDFKATVVNNNTMAPLCKMGIDFNKLLVEHVDVSSREIVKVVDA